MAISLYSAPLQGFTDYRFRNAFQKHFGGIDAYFAPYIKLNSKKEIKPATLRDILPENNQHMHLVPQVMTADTDEFFYVAQQVKQLGYIELNWNLGCPYPMVAKRGMGSGLLPHPIRIKQILERAFSESDIEISLKMRLGYESAQDIVDVLPVLNQFPIKHITIHPRIGKQMYKGEVDLEAFGRCMEQTQHTLAYNGNVHSFADYQKLSGLFPQIEHWMLGRGMIANPFLPAMIRQGNASYPDNKGEVFNNFHSDLLAQYSEALSGDKHIIQRMHQFWEYFIEMFPDNRKGLKRIKKAKNLEIYSVAVKDIIFN